MSVMIMGHARPDRASHHQISTETSFRGGLFFRLRVCGFVGLRGGEVVDNQYFKLLLVSDFAHQ